MNRISAKLGAVAVAALLTLTACGGDTTTPTSTTQPPTTAPTSAATTAASAPAEPTSQAPQAPSTTKTPAPAPAGKEKAYTVESLTALFESVQVGGSNLVAMPELNSEAAKKQVEDLLANIDANMTPAECVEPYREGMAEFKNDTIWVIGSNEHSGQAMLRDVTKSDAAERTIEKTKAFVEKCPAYTTSTVISGQSISTSLEQEVVDVEVPGLPNAFAYVIKSDGIEQYFVMGSLENVLVSATNFSTSGPVDPTKGIDTVAPLAAAVSADLAK